MSVPTSTVLLEFHEYHCVLVRWSDSSLLSVRTAPLDNKAAVAELRAEAASAAAQPGARLISTVSPKDRFIHRAGLVESSRPRDLSSLAEYIDKLPHGLAGSPVIAAGLAANGLPVSPQSTAPWWLVAAAPQSLADTRAILAEWGLAHARPIASLPAQLGASVASARQNGGKPVILWDLDSTRSHLILAGTGGIEAVQPLAFGYQQIFDAVQVALALRFRGAAARLLLSNNYDFAPHSAAIVGKILPALNKGLAGLKNPTGALHIAGLPDGVSWLTHNLAAATKLDLWQPDLPALAHHFGFDFARADLVTQLPPSAAGWFMLAGTPNDFEAWRPRWSDEQVTAPAALPPPSKSVPPPAAVIAVTVTPTTPQPAPTPRRPPAGKLIAASVLLLALAAGGYAWHSANVRREAELASAQATAARRLAEERARQARSEADRLRQETLAREQAAQAESLRLAREKELRLAAEIAASRPGTLTLKTSPASALVTVDGRPARLTATEPVTLFPGTHTVEISSPSHDPFQTTVTIRPGEPTDLGLVALNARTGSVALDARQTDVRYELRAKKSGLVLRSGRAPATESDLLEGDYTVVFQREGWSPQERQLTLAKGDTARAAAEYTTGQVVITSNPPGATIFKEGRKLGVTPYTLVDQPEGETVFALVLPDHEDARIGGRIEPGNVLKLQTTLDRLDRVVSTSQLSQLPRPLQQTQPEIPPNLVNVTGSVLVSFVVDRTGLPTGIRIEKAVDNEIARRCVAALENWRFSPGLTADGRPANVRVLVPFALGKN